MELREFNGNFYKVNDGGFGLRNDILSSALNQLKIMLNYHSKVHVLRFDLHQPTYTNTNKRISDFNRRFFRKITKEYGINRIGFVWCREQEKAKRQHYHYVLMVNGNKINHPSKLAAKARDVWVDMGGTYFLPENSFHNVVRSNHGTIQAAIWRISYLAKKRGKGYRPSQTKDYGSSRLTNKL